MELVRSYLYNRIPVVTENVNKRTFFNLIQKGWYEDTRSNKKFHLLNKRLQVHDQWYRLIIRFERQADSHKNGYKETYKLSIPCPFVITECEPLETDPSRWKDTKTYHGPRLGGILAFFKEGIPTEVMDVVYQEIKDCMTYHSNY